MRVNSRFSIGLGLAILAAGCGGHDDAEHDHAEAHGANEIELFEKNRGVRLPLELQRELGVATVEVIERSVPRSFEKVAQVYRAADGESPAGAVAWLEEAEADQARAGQSVTVRVRSPREPTVEGEGKRSASVGKVVRIAPSRGIAFSRREVLIELGDAENRFPAGAFLEVAFSPERPQMALTVPESAVIRGADGSFVYAANGGHFARTPVKTGARADGWMEITDGLYAGDMVVAQAVDSLWLIELCALKGGSPCCPVPTKKRPE